MNETERIRKSVHVMFAIFLLGIPIVAWEIYLGGINGITGAAFLLATGAFIFTQWYRLIDDHNREKQHVEMVAILERIADASQESRPTL